MKTAELKAEEVFRLRVDCPEEDRLAVGASDYGFLRCIQIRGGHFEGERIRGRVVPGGADWNTGFGSDDPNAFSCLHVFAKYLLQTDDGVYIGVENEGYISKKSERPQIVTTPHFRAPRGKYEWLNYGAYAGSLSGSVVNGVRGVDIVIYRLL